MQLRVEPVFSRLSYVRSVICDEIERAGALDEHRMYEFRLAVSEGLTNAMESHQRSSLNAPIEVSLEVTSRVVRVVIADQGGGFDPAKVKKAPPVTDPRRLEYERGMGLSLMRRLTDRCRVDSVGNGTTVVLEIDRQ